jgi:hypothetical protein
MKYCAKCGNPMEDDMLFCQKCGTRFEGVTEIAQSNIEAKITKMKKYNLVLDAQSISWQYLREDGERAGNITVKQDKLCVELVELIKDILESVADDERDFAEREVYTYVLQMSCKMCKEGEKLFSNYSGFKELFDMGNNLVRMGRLNPGVFLNQMIEQDNIYKTIAGLQGLHVSRIKEVLSEEVIYNNQEFQNLTKQLAIAFNDMWYKCVKRYTDFFSSPGEPFINSNWNIYNIIIKGLPMSVIDTLNESGWTLALDDWEKNHNGRQFKQDFLRKREQQRSSQRKKEEEQKKKEQEIADRQYWETHPEEYKQVEINKKKIDEILSNISSICKDIQALEKEKKSLDEQQLEMNFRISDKEQIISKLEKKIFGKKKAEEEIKTLDAEVTELKQELQLKSSQVEDMEKEISIKKSEHNTLEREIRTLEQEISNLRNG